MSRSLDDLSPLVRHKVDQWLAECEKAGLDILITCTLRTFSEQTALYAQGRTAPGHIVTNAKAGQSAHNFALALDFVPIVNGKPDWKGSDPCWAEAISLAEACGLESLAKSPFPEEAHLQLPNWKNFTGDTV